MRFEPELWDSLEEISRREGIGLGKLVRRIEQAAGNVGGRTSAVRVYVVTYFREAATEEGHSRAGHGAEFSPSRNGEAFQQGDTVLLNGRNLFHTEIEFAPTGRCAPDL